MLLAADIGGTKSLLGLFRRQKGRLRALRVAEYSSQAAPSFESLVERFLEGERLEGCAIGVAGPIVDGRSQVVNLRWSVDARRLARKLGLDAVQMLNDLEATGWGIPELPRTKLARLTPSVRPRSGNAALIAAGTGLGMCLLIADGDRWRPQASEGGHQQFGARTDLEAELSRFLRRRYGRVSLERVISGAGFSALYQFLIDAGHGTESAEMTRRLAAAADSNAEISAAGAAGEDALSEQVLDWWVSLYGAAAGDLALVSQAVGGIFVGGGIAPKILTRLATGGFVRSFRDKGRLAPFVARIPVSVILEPRTALIGAAACAEACRRPRTRPTRRAAVRKVDNPRGSRPLRHERKTR